MMGQYSEDVGDMKNNQQKSSEHGGKRRGAGRKAGTPNKVTADIRELAQRYGPESVEELARLAKEAQSEQARVEAIKEILDRAYGKSKQSVDVNATLSLRDLVLGSYRRE